MPQVKNKRKGKPETTTKILELHVKECQKTERNFQMRNDSIRKERNV